MYTSDWLIFFSPPIYLNFSIASIYFSSSCLPLNLTCFLFIMHINNNNLQCIFQFCYGHLAIGVILTPYLSLNLSNVQFYVLKPNAKSHLSSLLLLILSKIYNCPNLSVSCSSIALHFFLVFTSNSLESLPYKTI